MRAVLLVPAPEHREALLAEGPCGSRPPTRHRCGCGGWDHAGCAALLAEQPRALVLAWDGAVVPEGCDRATRLLERHGGYHPLRLTYLLDDAYNIAHACGARGIGSVVILDAHPAVGGPSPDPGWVDASRGTPFPEEGEAILQQGTAPTRGPIGTLMLKMGRRL